MVALAKFELSDNPCNESLPKKLFELSLAHYQAVIHEQSGNPESLEKLNETRETMVRLNSILTVSEQKRLQQLSLQYQGAQTLHESDLIQALNLTREQRLAMRVHEAEYHLRGGSRGGGPPGPPWENGKGPGARKPDDRKEGPGGPRSKKMVFPHREPHH